MNTIQKVALVGARGKVGAPTLRALLSHGFTVTVITRTSGLTFPGASVTVVDFGDASAVTDALRGHDALVDCARGTNDTRTRLIEAAAAAGIRRIIPCYFGMARSSYQTLPPFRDEAARDQLLERRCAETGMTWTIVENGWFLDWNMRYGFNGVDVRQRKGVLVDGAMNLNNLTLLHDVATAVVNVLKKLDETRNRAVRIRSCVKSIAQLLHLAQEAVGGEGWDVKHVTSKEMWDKAMADFEARGLVYEVHVGFICWAFAQADLTTPWTAEELDNELLGIKELSDDEIKGAIKAVAGESEFAL